MALLHATPGQVINLVGTEDEPAQSTVSVALFKSEQLEVLKLRIAKSKRIPAHHVAGEMTIQCLNGRVALTTGGATKELRAGQMVYLAHGDEHALEGLDDSTLLATIVLTTAR